MGQRKYSDDVVEKALDMRERGKSYTQIATSTGMSKSAICYHCARHGVEKPVPYALMEAPEKPTFYMRNGYKVLRFTKSDDALLLKRVDEGVSSRAIAKELNRKPHTVRNRLLAIYRKQDREEMGLAA